MKAFNRRFPARSGFTLAEVLISLTIASILMAAVGALIVSMSNSSKRISALTDHRIACMQACRCIATDIRTAMNSLNCRASRLSSTDDAGQFDRLVITYDDESGHSVYLDYRVVENGNGSSLARVTSSGGRMSVNDPDVVLTGVIGFELKLIVNGNEVERVDGSSFAVVVRLRTQPQQTDDSTVIVYEETLGI